MKARGGALREIREMFAPYCFHKKDTVPLHKLESGDYGYSNVSKFTLTDRTIVLKQIYFNDMEQERLSRLCSEYILLMRATNRYLNPPIGFIFNNPIIIATDEIPNGNLSTAIKENKLDPTDKTKIAMGVAYAMRRLHKMHLVHGDLKSKNVLLGDDFRPLVTDFSFGSIAHNLGAPIQYRITDPYWVAPEVLRGNPPTVKSDVYSFGALISELFNGVASYRGAGCLAHVDEDLLPTTAPKMMQALVKVCTNPDPSKRPDFRRIYRLFKNGICFFEGADLAQVRNEVMLIKADLHKSHLRFNPLIKTKLPSREEIQDLITKNGALNQKKRVQRTLAKSKMTIGVREARGIQLKRKCPVKSTTPTPANDPTTRPNLTAFMTLGPDEMKSPLTTISEEAETHHEQVSTPPSSPQTNNATEPQQSLNIDIEPTKLPAKEPAKHDLPKPLRRHRANNEQAGKGLNYGSSKGLSLNGLSLGKGNLGLSKQSVAGLSLKSGLTTPDSPIPETKSQPFESPTSKLRNLKFANLEELSGSRTPRMNIPPISSPAGTININTSYKGRISSSDRFKTVDDVDGRNYLRLPRRLRKQARQPCQQSIDIITVKERLYRSTSPIRTYKKEERRKLTKSLLCLAGLIKTGKIALPAMQNSEATPIISLSKQMMPLIRPEKQLPL